MAEEQNYLSGLLSHSDQFKHWQTARPELRINRGWFGYFADALQPDRTIDQIPMNISLSGQQYHAKWYFFLPLFHHSRW